MTIHQAKPMDELAVLLMASKWLIDSEARFEARQIIDTVRSEAYQHGYRDGRDDAIHGDPQAPTSLHDCE